MNVTSISALSSLRAASELLIFATLCLYFLYVFLLSAYPKESQDADLQMYVLHHHHEGGLSGSSQHLEQTVEHLYAAFYRLYHNSDLSCLD
jgi:Ca2+/Na+ antiporter